MVVLESDSNSGRNSSKTGKAPNHTQRINRSQSILIFLAAKSSRKFEYEDTAKDDTTFRVPEPQGFTRQYLDSIEDRMIDVMSSYPKMPILVRFNQHSEGPIILTSSIEKRLDADEEEIDDLVDITISKNNDPIKHLTVFSGRVNNLGNRLSVFGREHYPSMREFVSEEYRIEVEIEIEIDEFFEKKFFKYVFDRQHTWKLIPFMKQCKPIPGALIPSPVFSSNAIISSSTGSSKPSDLSREIQRS